MSYILLIEDNQQNADLAIRILSSAGYTVKHALKGLQGAKMARDERPDLILMDFELPDVTGLTATMVVRRQLGENAPPILMVSGHASEANQTAAKKVGCIAFLAKPYLPVQLLNTVRYLLQHTVKADNVVML